MDLPQGKSPAKPQSGERMQPTACPELGEAAQAVRVSKS